jgi:DNA-binding HxlR family transcriptional regulator
MSTGTNLQDQIAAPNVCKRNVLLRVSGLFGRKWHALILYQLHRDDMRFTDLKREIEGISGKMLSESLGILSEEYGLVERAVVSESPHRVEYSLSPAGDELEPILLALNDWGREHLES